MLLLLLFSIFWIVFGCYLALREFLIKTKGETITASIITNIVRGEKSFVPVVFYTYDNQNYEVQSQVTLSKKIDEKHINIKVYPKKPKWMLIEGTSNKMTIIFSFVMGIFSLIILL